MVFCDDAGMLTAAVVAGVADFLGAAATYGDVGVMCRARSRLHSWDNRGHRQQSRIELECLCVVSRRSAPVARVK
jgi:hypothetical protein